MFQPESGKVKDVAVALNHQCISYELGCVSYVCTLRVRDGFCKDFSARISKICHWALFYGYITVRLVRALHVRQSTAPPAVIISVNET